MSHKLTIGITHWPHCFQRVIALEQVLRSLYKHLIGLNDVQIIISILPGESIKESKKMLKRYPELKIAYQSSHLEGGDHIQAIRDVQSRPFFMYVQDDWWLREDLKVFRIIDNIIASDVVYVRMRWGNADRLIRIPNLYGSLDGIDIQTSYCYSDSPHIQSKEFERLVGRYPPNDFEHCYPLIHDPFWENRYNKMVKLCMRDNGLKVAVLSEENKDLWGHIGTPSGTRLTHILADDKVRYTMPKETVK